MKLLLIPTVALLGAFVFQCTDHRKTLPSTPPAEVSAEAYVDESEDVRSHVDESEVDRSTAESVASDPQPPKPEATAELLTLEASEPKFYEYEMAKSADIIPNPDGGVFLLSEEKEGGGVGAMITVNDPEMPRCDVRRVDALVDEHLPPIDGRPGVFFIPGSPGERLGVEFPNRDGWKLPVSFVVQFPGKPDPDPEDPPPPSGESLEKLSRSRADALNDPGTRAKIRDAVAAVLDEAARSGEVQQAARMVVSAIEGVLGARDRDDPSLDVPWKEGWRTPIGKAIGRLDPQTAAEYVAIYRTVLKGL